MRLHRWHSTLSNDRCILIGALDRSRGEHGELSGQLRQVAMGQGSMFRSRSTCAGAVPICAIAGSSVRRIRGSMFVERRALRVLRDECRRGLSGGERIGGIAVDQHLGRGAINENHHLAGAERRFTQARRGDAAFEPRFESFLVRGRDLQGRVARRTRQLGRRPDKSASFPARGVHR